jgi:hypothetical protein
LPRLLAFLFPLIILSRRIDRLCRSEDGIFHCSIAQSERRERPIPLLCFRLTLAQTALAEAVAATFAWHRAHPELRLHG